MSFLKLAGISFLLVIVSCANEKKEEETKTTTVKEQAVKKADTPEPKKTEVSVGPDGAEVKTKSGTEVKVSDKGATVGNKDVKIDLKKDEKQ